LVIDTTFYIFFVAGISNLLFHGGVNHPQLQQQQQCFSSSEAAAVLTAV
jgi:hypothetical protein